MAKIRCKRTDEDSFFGNFVYKRVIPKDHFMVKLKEVVDWQRYTRQLIKYYKSNEGVGQSPYDPALLLKMLLISYLYNISERQTEVMVNENLPVKFFVGLAVDEKSPDHSTLTWFKNRLIEIAGLKVYEEMFDEIIKIAREKGVKFGQLQIVDSVHVIADVNVRKDKQRQQEGNPPRDRDAGWGSKGKKTEETGNGTEKRIKYFYGYKDQVSLNSEAEMVTTVIPGQASDYDGHKLMRVVDKDLTKVKVDIVATDKGYDDGENHYALEQKGIHSAIRLNRRRLEKKDVNKDGWMKLAESPEYQQGIKERYKIERKFGEAKKWHGFERCRYLGYARHGIQSYLTFMALNLKRLVKILAGVSFRSDVKAYA
jgi:IS5 family transposase